MKLVSSLAVLPLFTHAQVSLQFGSHLSTGPVQMMTNFITDSDWTAALLTHGCWCAKLDADALQITLGGKNPVDDLDAICKKWIQTRSCTQIPSGSCEGVSRNSDHKYTVEYSTDHSDAHCPDSDKCLSETCQVDLYYVKELINFIAVNGNSLRADSNPVCEISVGTTSSHAHCEADLTTTASPTTDPCTTQALTDAADGYTPAAGDFATASQWTSNPGYTQLDSQFIRSTMGGLLLQKFQDAGFPFDVLSYTRVDYCSICTSDDHELIYSGNYLKFSSSSAAWDSNSFCNALGAENQYTSVYACRGTFYCGSVVWTGMSTDATWGAAYCGDQSRNMAGIWIKTDLLSQYATCGYPAVRSIPVGQRFSREKRE